MINIPPSFEEHMHQRQRDQRDQINDVIKSLLKLKLISTDEAVMTPTEIARALNERVLAFSLRLQEATDLKQKIDLLSAQMTLATAINLLSVALSNDTKSDTRRINALIYMR